MFCSHGADCYTKNCANAGTDIDACYNDIFSAAFFQTYHDLLRGDAADRQIANNGINVIFEISLNSPDISGCGAFFVYPLLGNCFESVLVCCDILRQLRGAVMGWIDALRYF